MKKIQIVMDILMVAMLIVVIWIAKGWCTQRDYSRDGGHTYSTFIEAHTAASTGDTIVAYSNDTIRTVVNLKAVTIKSSGNIYTLYVKPGLGTSINAANNVFYWDSLNLGYYDSTVTSFNYLLQKTSGGGWIKNSRLFAGNPYQSSNKRCFILSKTSGTTTNKFTLYNVTIDSLRIYASTNYLTLMDSVYIENSVLNYSQFVTGANWVISNNRINGNIANGVIDSNFLFEYNYCDLATNGGEWLGSDPSDFAGQNANLKNITIRYNVFVGNNHVVLCVDGWDTSTIVQNRFYNVGGSGTIYNHNNQGQNKNDSLVIANNSFYNPDNINAIVWAVKNPESQSNNIVIKYNFITGGLVKTDSCNNVFILKNIHTKTSSVYTLAPATGYTYSVTDTMLGRSKLVLSDTVYNFVNRDSSIAYGNGYYIGANGFMLFKNDTTIGSNSFTFACSLSTLFFNTNPIAKDSASIGIRISTDKSTWYDTTKTIKFKAGTVSNATVNSLAAGTYYYKVYSLADSSKGIADTIPVDSFTIASIASAAIRRSSKTSIGLDLGL